MTTQSRITGTASQAARNATGKSITAPHTPWPEGVTTRFLTYMGELTGDLNATVDIVDTGIPTDGFSTAICRPCGDSTEHLRTHRPSLLSWAQEHAVTCRALAQPAA
ncbi:hypothetical protein ACFQ0X_43735 [Streptomyces rectiviolaceus]|uniref:Uncharacterized protein n=1 Tax=Streptomyces rectiviolaceus TaxID=332591 RepID=A0ABP6NM60_9ACTN